MSELSRVLGFGVALATPLLVTSIGRAQPARYELRYEAPPECPPNEAFAESVASLVPDPTLANGARLEVVITAVEGGFAGDLAVSDAAGATRRRHLGADSSCAVVARALALMSSVAIKLGGVIEDDGSTPASPPPLAPPVLEPAPKPAKVAPPPAAPTPPSPVEVSVFGGAGFVGFLGPLLRPSVELGVSVGDRKMRLWSPWGSVALVGGRSTITDERGSLGLWLLEGRVGVCPLRLGIPVFRMSPCAGIAAGAVFARSSRIAGARSETSPHVAAETTAHVSWHPLPAFFAFAEGGPSFRLVGAEFYFHGPRTTIYEQPVVSGRASIGVGARF